MNPSATAWMRVDVVRAIVADEASEVRNILVAVTPGGGKSLLPVQALVATGVCVRICWVVPHDSLRLQVEEVFADTAWRQALRHKTKRLKV